jgi:methyl-accepting chemotaxis protein
VSQAAAEQLSNATQAGVEAVSHAAGTLSRQVQDQVRDNIAKPAGQLAEQVSQAASRGVDAVEDVVAKGRRLRHDMESSLADGAERMARMAEGAVHSVAEEAPSLVPEAPRAQDTVLLGIAGVAVAAALGFALHRSANEA